MTLVVCSSNKAAKGHIEKSNAQDHSVVSLLEKWP